MSIENQDFLRLSEHLLERTIFKQNGVLQQLCGRLKCLLFSPLGDERDLSFYSRHAWTSKSIDVTQRDFYLKSEVFQVSQIWMFKDSIRWKCYFITTKMLFCVVANFARCLQLMFKNADQLRICSYKYHKCFIIHFSSNYYFPYHRYF